MLGGFSKLPNSSPKITAIADTIEMPVLDDPTWWSNNPNFRTASILVNIESSAGSSKWGVALVQKRNGIKSSLTCLQL